MITKYNNTDYFRKYKMPPRKKKGTPAADEKPSESGVVDVTDAVPAAIIESEVRIAKKKVIPITAMVIAEVPPVFAQPIPPMSIEDRPPLPPGRVDRGYTSSRWFQVSKVTIFYDHIDRSNINLGTSSSVAVELKLQVCKDLWYQP